MIYNDTNYTFNDWGVGDIEYADEINPGGVATWDGNFSAYRERGGKILTYHGRFDGVRSTAPHLYAFADGGIAHRVRKL